MRDLIAHPDAALEVCRHRALRGEEGCSVEAFPHPKRKGQVRWFTCADPFDELPVRITVDEIARVADAGVSPQAFGYRLHPKPPHQVWQYKHLGRAHKRLRKESTRSIRSKSFECLVIADLRGFYHSVDVAVLTGLLVGGGCQPVAVATLRDELDSFSGRSSLPGMPIGLEAGGLLANVYLTPADRALAIEGLNFVHWGDDYFFFLTKADTVENTMHVLAEQGRGLGFSIADDKTDIIWDPEKAQQRVRDRMLSYAEVALELTAPSACT
jgi:Reverse transcriptase (RNA-dependent DNA polymerase)